jgi:hypothetical protein
MPLLPILSDGGGESGGLLGRCGAGFLQYGYLEDIGGHHGLVTVEEEAVDNQSKYQHDKQRLRLVQLFEESPHWA